ncbi:gliding motility lipoprotein GldH [Hymenobacter sp. BRD67]|uniref:gliding motility lipoprotein GldH n=1 Tax=Hymenobacter sp. BRD67 TaxID=2675877 RepID=UPI0020B83A6A|nr:gliding motility lipoprotein GldH [Hymenobacter sp. BRD67]
MQLSLASATSRVRRNGRALLALAGLASLSACDPNRVYEENVDLKSPTGDAYVWDVQQRPAFTFTITDTTARYNVFFNVRNASGYGFYNLYLKHTLTGPNGRPVGPRYCTSLS